MAMVRRYAVRTALRIETGAAPAGPAGGAPRPRNRRREAAEESDHGA
ncbi:hypothetical protein HDA36_005825 [Nocardiopsis composta]|uniref:Uncharacterized protein n=1 Tax=Nocardiopsis composta TaxID=157465 RepID=A0A7W8QS92_9ACTN|nr:hypothetical protein [Nocardiopsis composta]